MLFHIKHHHEASACIAHQPDEVKRVVAGMMKKAEAGVVEVRSFVVDVPHHDIYWIVEADTAAALHDFLDSGLEWGIARSTPVIDGMEAIQQRMK